MATEIKLLKNQLVLVRNFGQIRRITMLLLPIPVQGTFAFRSANCEIKDLVCIFAVKKRKFTAKSTNALSLRCARAPNFKKLFCNYHHDPSRLTYTVESVANYQKLKVQINDRYTLTHQILSKMG